MLVIFQAVEIDSTIDLNMVQLTPIWKSDSITPVYEMKYSSKWSILGFSTKTQNQIGNYLELFSVEWDATLHCPYISRLGEGSSFLYRVSPFMV